MMHIDASIRFESVSRERGNRIILLNGFIDNDQVARPIEE
jgi:hypothetical protein